MFTTDQIRRATPSEASLLTELAHASKKHWGYPDEWLNAWAEQLTFSADDIERDDVYVFTDVDERPIACYAIRADGGCAELNHFWVHPNYVGMGVGRLMFLHAGEIVRALGCKTIIIDSDPNAEGFYERMGAERITMVYADVCGTKRVLPRLHYNLQV